MTKFYPAAFVGALLATVTSFSLALATSPLTILVA
jgi:hypothetical protein